MGKERGRKIVNVVLSRVQARLKRLSEMRTRRGHRAVRFFCAEVCLFKHWCRNLALAKAHGEDVTKMKLRAGTRVPKWVEVHKSVCTQKKFGVVKILQHEP